MDWVVEETRASMWRLPSRVIYRLAVVVPLRSQGKKNDEGHVEAEPHGDDGEAGGEEASEEGD
jgi:hypothetical protein